MPIGSAVPDMRMTLGRPKTTSSIGMMCRPGIQPPRWAAQAIARAAGRLSRTLGRGGGTTVPGVVMLGLRPRAAEELRGRLARGSIAISATNGKTTTARLIDAAATQAGCSTIANTAGSNLLSGVTAALLDGRDDTQLGVFEVDEAALPAVVDQIRPHVVVLMNLFRDQLDRYGELETLVARWSAMVGELDPTTTLVLNADDPAIAFLGHGRPKTVYFGLDVPQLGRGTLAHAADSTHCPRCDESLDYELIAIGHMGHWRCPACGLEQPRPAVLGTNVQLDRLDGFRLDVATPRGALNATVALPGLHNAYNAVAAVAAAQALDLPDGAILDALATTQAAFGRGERIVIDGRELLLLLAKNPAGANENIRSALLAEGDLHMMVFLNDRTADGQDVSWIWDVDYEPLFERLASLTISGDRAHDLALRFVYGGMSPDRMIVEPDVHAAVDVALAAAPAGATIHALPTYTAMLDLRADLVDRGVTHDFWDER